jgi:hypothetical protein
VAAPLGAEEMTAKPSVATAHADAVAITRDRNFEFLMYPPNVQAETYSFVTIAIV